VLQRNNTDSKNGVNRTRFRRDFIKKGACGALFYELEMQFQENLQRSIVKSAIKPSKYQLPFLQQGF
jgi:hypothetical protein